MSFLNATLIFGAVAAAVPVVLHLLSRREPQRVVFPAVRFLTQRIETHRSRLRIRRWLLLAFRALLLALLAFALAQPQIHREMATTWLTIGTLALIGIGFGLVALLSLGRDFSRRLRQGLGILGGGLLLVAGLWTAVALASGPGRPQSAGGAVAVALVFDNSPRSGYATAEGTRLAAMQAMGGWLLNRYPPGSRLAVLDRSPRPASFSLDRRTALRSVEKLAPRQATRPLSERVEAAIRLVRTSDLPARKVFVLSDLTRASWTPTDGSDAAALLPPLLAEEPPVAVQVIDVGGEDQSNRWLGNMTLADASPARDVSVPLDVDLHVAAGAGSRSVAAELRLFEASPGLPVFRDGELVLPPLRAVDRTLTEVRSGSPAQLYLTLPPLDIGVHHAQVRLLGSDPLAVDDVRYLTVTVRPPASLLLVGEEPAEMRVLGQALSPYFELEDPRGEYRIERIPYAELTSTAIANQQAIALLDPAGLAASLETTLREWVQAGGRLFIALGPRLPVPAAAVPGSSAGPGSAEADGGDARAETAPSGSLWGKPLRIWRVPPPGSFWEVASPDHPVFAELAALPGGVPWSDFPVRRYWQMEPRRDERILARYAGTFHGGLLEWPLGQGSVLTMTTPLPALRPPADQWNDLFSGSDAWPAFIYVQQLFEYLAGRDSDAANVQVGEAVALTLLANEPSPQASEPNAWPSRLQMFSPALPPTPVPADGPTVVPGVIETAGNYWLRGAGATAGFSANLPTAATSLERIEAAVLEDVFGAGNFTLARQREEIAVADAAQASGRPLYSQAMLLVLACFLIEQIFSNRFYAAERSPAKGGSPAASRWPPWRRLKQA